MTTTKETLEMCKIIVDALAVGAMNGFSYNPASMVELSGYIVVAIERETPDKTCAAPNCNNPGIYNIWLCSEHVHGDARESVP